MKSWLALSLAVSVFAEYGPSAYRASQEIELPAGSDIIKLAFGSCYGIWDFDSGIFEKVHAEQPDVFVWLGDAAYVDKPDMSFAPVEDADYVRKRFTQTRETAFYGEMLARTKVMGVWDDHDYGTNDGGKTFLYKVRNREIFLDFLEEPADTDRRLQKDSPIHQDYFISKGNNLVHLLLLDNRYDYDKYGTKDYLGRDQLAWLDLTLQRGKQRKVTLTVIGAGIQFLTDRRLIESLHWNDKKPLFDMLKKYEVSNVAFISGDVHFSQFYENRCPSLTGQTNLFELCSSGLSHSQAEFFPTPKKNMDLFTPEFYVASDVYMDLNFGMLEINASALPTEPLVLAMTKNRQGVTVLSMEFTAEQLKFDADNLKFGEMCKAKVSKQQVFTNMMHFAHFVIDLKSWHAILLLLVVVQAIVSAFLAVVIRLTFILVKMIRK